MDVHSNLYQVSNSNESNFGKDVRGTWAILAALLWTTVRNARMRNSPDHDRPVGEGHQLWDLWIICIKGLIIRATPVIPGMKLALFCCPTCLHSGSRGCPQAFSRRYLDVVTLNSEGQDLLVRTKTRSAIVPPAFPSIGGIDDEGGEEKKESTEPS